LGQQNTTRLRRATPNDNTVRFTLLHPHY
jgi:hypothetical protein